MSNEPTDGSYEFTRKKLRYGLFQSGLLIIVSTVGLTIFTYPYAFAKVGWILGFIYSGCTVFFTSYSMYRLSRITDDIEIKHSRKEEKDNMFETAKLTIPLAEETLNPRGKEFLVKRFQDFPSILKYENARTWEVGIIIVTTIANLISNLLNFTMITTLLRDFFSYSDNMLKLAALPFFIVILFLVIEPEKLKMLTGLSLILFLFVVFGFFYDSAEKAFKPSHQPRTIEEYKLENTGLFLGIGSYAFESIATIFNVRRTMRKRSRMPKLIVITFVIIGGFYALFGFFTYLAYGDEGIKESSFDYYNEKTNKTWVSYLKYTYLVLVLYNIPFNCIFTSESFEDEEYMRGFFKEKGSESLKRSRILLFRVLFLVLCFLVSLMSDKLSKILDIGGSIVSPFLSFIFPILFTRKFENQTPKRKRGFFTGFSDIATILFGVLVGTLGNYYAIFQGD